MGHAMSGRALVEVGRSLIIRDGPYCQSMVEYFLKLQVNK